MTPTELIAKGFKPRADGSYDAPGKARRWNAMVKLSDVERDDSPRDELCGQIVAASGQRIRQDKPMNKLERDFELVLKTSGVASLRAQSLRFRLASGAWYRPDFTAFYRGRMTAWETKGPKAARWSRRGELTIKFAAAAWPEWRWILVWKDAGEWRQQIVLP